MRARGVSEFVFGYFWRREDEFDKRNKGKKRFFFTSLPDHFQTQTDSKKKNNTLKGFVLFVQTPIKFSDPHQEETQNKNRKKGEHKNEKLKEKMKVKKKWFYKHACRKIFHSLFLFLRR